MIVRAVKVRQAARRVEGKLCACAAVLVSLSVATAASAFDDEIIGGEHTTPQAVWAEVAIPALAMHDPDARVHEGSRVGWVLEQLKRIPLRPVKIGDTPRKPDDPEPGAGVVFKIRF